MYQGVSIKKSFLQDYITEKFYNILPLRVIPVVLTGADMSQLAPPHSYIR